MTFYQMMTGKKEVTAEESQLRTTGVTGTIPASMNTAKRVEEILETDNKLIKEVKLDKEELVDKAKAFEKYRRYYRKNEFMEESKGLLKKRMEEGRDLGIEAKDTREEIRSLTIKIESLRKERVMRGNNIDEDDELDEERELQTHLAELRQQYQTKYSKLKTLKHEIERLKKQIDRSWKNLQADFSEWHQSYGKATSKAPMGMTSDKQVQDDLKAFYKAKEQIYK